MNMHKLLEEFISRYFKNKLMPGIRENAKAMEEHYGASGARELEPEKRLSHQFLWLSDGIYDALYASGFWSSKRHTASYNSRGKFRGIAGGCYFWRFFRPVSVPLGHLPGTPGLYCLLKGIGFGLRKGKSEKNFQ